MHLVLLHGYLLQGTGSNIYVTNVAKAWKRQGHAVTVVCQEPQAGGMAFVDEYVGPGEPLPPAAPAPGSLRVVVPDIGALLPVYVFDRYEGYRVKTIPEMTAEECETHISMTAAVLRAVVSQGGRRRHVLANHALFGPVIARRALAGTGVAYDVKIHGSAVEYTLVPHPELMSFATEGLASAGRIFVGSRYVKHRMLEVFAAHRRELGLDEKLSIVPPGMDPEIFDLADDFQSSHSLFLENVAAMTRANDQGRRQHPVAAPEGQDGPAFHDALIRAGQDYDQRAVDADLLHRWPRIEPFEPLVLYFGKFLPAKGVGEIVAVAPTVLSKIPLARFVFVGFGSYREHLEGMIQALKSGDRELFAACGRAGEFVEIEDLSPWFRTLAPGESERIVVTGMLDHATLGHLLPLASLTVVPSKWPEAFGMVAVEAMAAGVLPLCIDHAGLSDVIEEVRASSPRLADLMRLDREKFVEQLPGKIQAALAFLYPNGLYDTGHRRSIAERLRGIAVEKFSWDGISRRLIEGVSGC